PLAVLRRAPEGEVALAPGLSVTFSQPMVAVSSQNEAAAVVPVRLAPQPKGSWRWLGSQTLVFQPEAEGGRMPMATEYTVTVPAGTRSALGSALPQAETFTFATAPPTLTRSHPGGPSRARDELIFLEFDQRVDPARVLAKLELRPAAGGARLRLATAEEIAADEDVKALAERAQEGRWLALRAVTPDGATKDALPSDTEVHVVVTPGTPSAEGPRATAVEQSFNFRTYGPLRVTGTECGYDMRCAPSDHVRIIFTNALDPGSFSASKVAVSPEIPGAQIWATGNSIYIQGEKLSNTTYTVTLAPTLKDAFGQTLAGDSRVTFKVNEAAPRLGSPSQGMVVLDPAGRRSFSVYSTNHRRLRVRLYKVTPADWPQFIRYELEIGRQTVTPPPPGALVFDQVVELKSKPGDLTETVIDLSPALRGGRGQVFVLVEPAEKKGDPVRVYGWPSQGQVWSWVQATEIGLDAFVDRGGLVAWANSLRDGGPLADVEMTVVPEGVGGKTGADGLARLAFTDAPYESRPPLLVARRGDDLAILPRFYQPYYGDQAGSWHTSVADSQLGWFVFDDRKMYRPGEEVSVKGWVRKINLTPAGDTELLAAANETVNYVLKDSRNNEISKGSTRLNALAGFDLRLRLPATMHLGYAYLEFELDQRGGTHAHHFQVQEFRRPEFEITARTSEAPHFVGAGATVSMAATYYTGGGLADTEVNWEVISRPTNYTPPNRDDYTFGKFQPWWGEYREDGETNTRSLKGKTDAEGRHVLRIDFDGVDPARPSHVTADAVVQDVNRQTLSASADMLVHPADVYVGLKSARTFVQQGEPLNVEAIVTDLDGRALAGCDVELKLARLDYVYEYGQWRQEEAEAQEQSVKSGAEGTAGVRFATKAGGAYRLTARVRDRAERPNESELLLWVAGGKLPPVRGVEREKAELIPSRKTYAGGEVAEILVRSPFAPAEGVLTLRRSGLVRSERFTMTESSHTLRVPIEEAMTPNLRVQVDLVGAQPRVGDAGEARADLPKRAAYASGEINLSVPPAARRLKVSAAPRDAVLEPGAETVVDVEVRDAQGAAVGGTEMAVVVVDEAVLALTNYRIGDPLAHFYPQRDAGVNDHHLRERLRLASPAEVERMMREGEVDPRQITELPINGRDPSVLAVLERGSQGVVNHLAMSETVMVTSSGADPSINPRQNFNALAVFAASVPTDARGRASVKVRLPDNLTRYRVTAVAVAGGKQAGAGESVITARKRLMARPSAPRFLNYGDRAELPVVLQNQTGDALRVNVAVRATNAQLTAGAGRSVTVPANDRVEVRFPVAAVLPGTARFQVVASSGLATDAAEVSLPVYTPATTEAFATYGVIDEGSVAQPVKAPADAVPSFGGLEVTTASTQLQELTDAFIYLQTYPYECSEQIASRVISVAALKDVLAAFKADELPSPEEMREAVAADLKTLSGLQNDDGGFDFWRRSERSFPYVSVHVAHALARARMKGFAVPEETLEKSRDYLREIEKKIPAEYSAESRRAIQAYALYVRALMDDRDTGEAREMIDEAGGVEKLSLESLGWLLQVLSGDGESAAEVAGIRRHLNNGATETAGAAHFADSYSDGALTVLVSDRRADGVLLDALINDQPQNDLIPKLVRGLLAHRKQGRWENTQENVFILLALDRYFNTYEKT
ncbi:MAG TPA: alpha-2-macroglobulin family protein, partial [Pyrinomonadaceae bacterium]|nr:alpha-2-macroglobulin family protein [Pyrinomonadaceae bacterium]